METGGFSDKQHGMVRHVSLAERFRRGDESMSPIQGVEKEITTLHEAGNSEGMRDLFNAYCEWETRVTKNPSETPDALRTRAMSNFDTAAKMADASLAFRLDQDDTGTAVGPVTKFYRGAIGYNPET